SEGKTAGTCSSNCRASDSLPQRAWASAASRRTWQTRSDDRRGTQARRRAGRLGGPPGPAGGRGHPAGDGGGRKGRGGRVRVHGPPGGPEIMGRQRLGALDVAGGKGGVDRLLELPRGHAFFLPVSGQLLAQPGLELSGLVPILSGADEAEVVGVQAQSL